MKITAKDIRFAHNIISHHGGIDLGGTGRLKVARISRAVRNEVENITDANNGLVREHSEINPDGTIKTNGVVPALKDVQAFNAAHRKLMDTEIELAVEPLTVAEHAEVKGDTSIIDALLPFVEAPKA